MLTIFRRHSTDCPHKSRRYRRCQCPIHVEGSLAGEKVRKALNLTSWKAAEALIREWEVTGKLGGVLAKTESIPRAIDAYLADCVARKLSPRSVARYRAFLERSLLVWTREEEIRDVRSLTFEKVAKFRSTWVRWSAYTSAKNLELLRMFLRFAKRCGWIDDNPAEELKSPKVQVSPTLPFTEEEEEAIYLACNDYRINGRQGRNGPARIACFVMTLRYTGMRIGDVATLEVSRLQGDKIHLYTAKTGQPVMVPIPPWVRDSLLTQATKNPNPKYFFWSGESTVKCVTVMWQRSLATLFKKAKVENGHAHRFRDTFSTRLLEAGVSIENVAALLGHSNVQITQRHYAPWVRGRQEALAEAVRQTWPPFGRPSPDVDKHSGSAHDHNCSCNKESDSRGEILYFSRTGKKSGP